MNSSLFLTEIGWDTVWPIIRDWEISLSWNRLLSFAPDLFFLTSTSLGFHVSFCFKLCFLRNSDQGIQKLGSLELSHHFTLIYNHVTLCSILSSFIFSSSYTEKAMALHSSTLAWRIPGTREPGELPSMGSHRVGHDWNDLAAAAVYQFKFICLPLYTHFHCYSGATMLPHCC